MVPFFKLAKPSSGTWLLVTIRICHLGPAKAVWKRQGAHHNDKGSAGDADMAPDPLLPRRMVVDVFGLGSVLARVVSASEWFSHTGLFREDNWSSCLGLSVGAMALLMTTQSRRQ